MKGSCWQFAALAGFEWCAPQVMAEYFLYKYTFVFLSLKERERGVVKVGVENIGEWGEKEGKAKENGKKKLKEQNGNCINISSVCLIYLSLLLIFPFKLHFITSQRLHSFLSLRFF